MRLSAILRPVTHLKMESFRELSHQRFGPEDAQGTNWDYFQSIVETFFEGLYIAIDTSDETVLVRDLDRVSAGLRGFAYEGAGMGLMLLDVILPFRNRFRSFVQGLGKQYEELLYIGAGVAFGYLREGMPVRLFGRNPDGFVDRQNPMVRWLVMDGYGFFDGMVNWQKVIDQQKRPHRLSGYSLRAYDRGVGRSLWICTGADPSRFCQAIRPFPQSRQADLWGGIGEGCAYAGGAAESAPLRHIAHQAGDHADHFAAGVVIGSVGRVRSGHSAPHTDLACESIWECGPFRLTEMADQLAIGLSGAVDERDQYEEWHTRIRQTWAAEHSHIAELHL